MLSFYYYYYYCNFKYFIGYSLIIYISLDTM